MSDSQGYHRSKKPEKQMGMIEKRRFLNKRMDKSLYKW
jgi:hypothetical protein